MSDNTERIVVEVDGSGASEGFGRVRQAAASADSTIDHLGSTIDKVESKLGGIGSAGGRAASGLNQTASAGPQAASGINAASTAAQNATSHFDALQRSLFGVRGKAAFIWDLAADGFRMATGFAQSFIERTSAVQRTFSLLATIPGANAGEEFAYLTKVANNYGLSLRAIQDDYAKMNLAAQNTSMTGEGVRRVFEQVSMATRTLHLNQQQTQLTFLAVEQMLSKGKISMEELRKQFAERIPGAMQALAREMGITYPQLEKFITKVGAASDKIVPLLGDAVQRLYQNAIPNASKALDAEMNRIQTSVAVFFKNVVQAGGTEGMSNLLRTINGLMQTDTMAEVFANAMNKITNQIAGFLSTLKPEQIESFGKTALEFLSSFATLAVMAGKAIMFISQNLPALGTAIGAFVGATAGAPLGPWGAAVGMIAGGAAGFMATKSASGSLASPSAMQSMNDEYVALDKRVSELQTQVSGYSTSGLSGVLNKINPAKTTAERRLREATDQRDVLKTKLEPYWANLVNSMSPTESELPGLGDQKSLRSGSDADTMKWLKENFGMGGDAKKSKEQVAAERLALRQKSAIEDLEAKVRALRDPEHDAFDTTETNMAQLGIKQGHPLFDRMKSALDEMLAIKNRKAQDISDKKTQGTEGQFADMMTLLNADKQKFSDKYDKTNLLQIDENDWVAKARKMGSELDSVLTELRSKWDREAQKNPLFMLGVDRDKEIADLRATGAAYIDEFKRIEEEKRSVLGGGKAFLKEWNNNVQDFGKMTQDFLKGVTDGMVDMLFNLVRYGEFSFKKLTEFILSYIMKMLIVQAITPFVNFAVGALTSGFSSFMGTAASSIGSTYSLGSGGGGLGLKMRAAGGPVWPGEPFLVGERGPEIVTFNGPGYVHPNESLRSGGGSVNVQVNVDANGRTDVKGSGSGADIGRRIGDAVRSVLVQEMRPGGMLA